MVYNFYWKEYNSSGGDNSEDLGIDLSLISRWSDHQIKRKHTLTGKNNFSSRTGKNGEICITMNYEDNNKST